MMHCGVKRWKFIAPRMPILVIVGLLLIILIPRAKTAAQDGKEVNIENSAGNAPSILVFTDDPVHLTNSNFILRALDYLGYDATIETSSMELFEGQLTEAPWDLVIFANDVTQPTGTIFDSLQSYVEGGDRLIAHTFYMADVSQIPLWDLLGVSYVDTNVVVPSEQAAAMCWWEDTHQVFNTPVASVPDFLAVTNFLPNSWPVQHAVSVSVGFEALGGIGAVSDPNLVTLAIGNSGQTVFRGFIDLIVDGDSDSDGFDDGLELWINLISYVLRPVDFSKTNPADGSTGNPLSLTLNWGSSAGATSYDYCVDTTDNSACDGGQWISAGDNTSTNVSGLIPGTQYFWQARANNSEGSTEADNGSWWNFRTSVPPGAFDKQSPVNNSTNVPPDVTLVWGSSSGADGYEYCFDLTNNNACDGDSWIATTNTSANTGALAHSTAYYWQVRAVNNVAEVEADSGAWWKFTTIYEPVSAAFSGLPTRGIGHVLVDFTNESTGDFDTCAWIFGDGGSSDSCDNPSDMFTMPGVYTVSLSISGLGGADTATIANYILVDYGVFLPAIIRAGDL